MKRPIIIMIIVVAVPYITAYIAWGVLHGLNRLLERLE